MRHLLLDSEQDKYSQRYVAVLLEMLTQISYYDYDPHTVFFITALFVYRQPFESGGSRFYYWSRMTLVTCYCSVIIFAGMLAFKSYADVAISYLIIMIWIVYLVDRAITKRFVVHSLELPMKLVAEEEVALISDSNLSTQNEEASFIYRSPVLNPKSWQ